MKKADATREKLLTQARALMWARGFGAVSLREVSQAAGVDVALVSRYFGGKKGLFEATLDGAFTAPPIMDEALLVDAVTQMFVTTPRGSSGPSILQMMLMNAHDEEVGDMVRAAHHAEMQTAIEAITGDPTRAALFMAAIMGMSVAEKSMHLPGIAPYDTPAYEAQLRHMLNSALAYRG